MLNSPASSELDVLEAESSQRNRCGRKPKSQLLTNQVNTYPLSQNWRVAIYPELQSGLADWAKVAGQDDLFTSAAYLAMLDSLEFGGVRNGLAIFQHPERGSFGLILQVFEFAARDQLGNLNEETKRRGWQKVTEGVRRGVANWLNFRVVTAGQLLLTGNHHGLAGIKQCDIAARSTLARLIDEGLDQIAQQWPQRIHGVLLKDLPLADIPRAYGYHPLPVQPNMVLPITRGWTQFEDYTAAMTSKYRVRVRRARKKGAELRRQVLSLNDLVSYQSRMYALFRQIADQSEFNPVELPPDYFLQWARHFPEAVEITGYFAGDKLVGFTTTIQNNADLEAHYLGLDASYNPTHQLYLNMLYDMVEKAIEVGADELVLSRTALEIKSSIGAVPRELPCWLRGRKRWSSKLIPLIAPYVAPPSAWTQRHPFKS